MSRARVTVHLIDPRPATAGPPTYCLSAEEHQRATRFKNPTHAHHWSACRSALRTLLAAHLGTPPLLLPLVTTSSGKPVLAPPYDFLHFNLSHCDDLALIAISTSGPLGIDVEPLARAASLTGCESTFCHPQEIAALPDQHDARSRRLLEIWTAKEAFLKALGTGFLTPPETVRIDFHQSQIIASPADGSPFEIIRLPHPLPADHLAHLCALQPLGALEMVASSPLLRKSRQSDR